MKSKKCSKCKKEKSFSDFQKHKGHADGLASLCKECCKKNYWKNVERYRKEALEQYYKNSDSIHKKNKENYNPIKKRRDWIKSRYGLSDEDWNKIFQFQKGKCAICGKHQSELKKILHVDHNHKTSEIRGLLCQQCNAGIGFLDVDSVGDLFLKKAVEYINIETKEIENARK